MLCDTLVLCSYDTHAHKIATHVSQTFTLCILQVRDALREATGEHYDSVLINYYEDERCACRCEAGGLQAQRTGSLIPGWIMTGAAGVEGLLAAVRCASRSCGFTL